MRNVGSFGAVGDGIHDDTAALQKAVDSGDGQLALPSGDYLLTEPIRVDLARCGRFGLDGAGGTVKVIMAGVGPAFHLVGSHDASADPGQFSPEIWSRERMPVARNVEIEGRHPEADGFLVEGTMQSTFEGLLLRGLRHAIRVHRRARNVLISHCHLYNNSGVGVFLDRVNLHQVIVSGSHISYCRQGGIRVEGSQIRNLQVTGNDIEYNFDPDAPRSADIWIDSSHPEATVREGTIVSNTIQAMHSPGGANVRILGHEDTNNKAGLFTISNNLIGTQDINVHLVSCRGVVLNGNVIYGGRRRNVLAEGCRHLVMAANLIEHNPDYKGTGGCRGVRLQDSEGCTVSGCTIADSDPGPSDEQEGLLEVERCRRVTVIGCQITDGFPRGLYIRDSQGVLVTGCTVEDTREPPANSEAVLWTGRGERNRFCGNSVGPATGERLRIEKTAGVHEEGNDLG
jgi:hypothetical protein